MRHANAVAGVLIAVTAVGTPAPHPTHTRPHFSLEAGPAKVAGGPGMEQGFDVSDVGAAPLRILARVTLVKRVHGRCVLFPRAAVPYAGVRPAAFTLAPGRTYQTVVKVSKRGVPAGRTALYVTYLSAPPGHGLIRVSGGVAVQILLTGPGHPASGQGRPCVTLAPRLRAAPGVNWLIAGAGITIVTLGWATALWAVWLRRSHRARARRAR
jgi:hypothetical protein